MIKKYKIWGISFFILLMVVASTAVLAKSKKAVIKELFNHDMHTEIFTGSNVACDLCHVKDQYTWDKMDKGGCHKCHNSPKPVMPATSRCQMCHEKYKVKPTNHTVAWQSEHKTFANAKPDECKACHNDRFCIKCHEQRDDVGLNVHKRNYRYFHSIDVRLDPKKCDRCHDISFCTKCHTDARRR